MMTSDRTPSERLFPEISSQLYSRTDSTAATTDGSRVLGLAHGPLTFAQRYLDRNIDEAQRLGRALGLHRDAIEAELAARFERADFFWRQLQTEFKAFDVDQWTAAMAAVGSDVAATLAGDPGRARAALVREVFIDTHLAFYRGYQLRDAPMTTASRAFIHFTYVTEWLTEIAPDPATLLTLLTRPAEALVAVCRNASDWQRAITICETVLKHCPEAPEFPERLVGLIYQEGMGRLKGGTNEGDARRNAKLLLDVVQRIESVRDRYPYCSIAYDFLAHLHHTRAIQLANSGTLSQALRACEEALAHDPGFQEAEATRKTLIDLMKNLQQQVSQLLAEVASRPNATLNAKGVQMRDDAHTGFDLIVQYQNSKEREKVLEDGYSARARGVWQRIGLPPPLEDFDARARLLLSVLSDLLRSGRTGQAAITKSWRTAVTAHPEFASLDSDLVVRFLKNQVSPEGQSPQINTDPASVAGVTLAPLVSHRVRGGEPFGYWLFSRQDRRIKWQLAAAVVLLLVSGGLLARDAMARTARDSAYAEVVEAAQLQQHDRVIGSAERFLANSALAGPDARQSQVIGLYEEALVRWVAAQQGEPGPELLARAETYRKLVAPRE